MPLYEYECDTNGHRFERIQKFSDPPIETCPVCGGHVHKLFSSPAIQFKGSGWYITDYARAGKSDDGKSAPAKSGEAGSSTSSTESSTLREAQGRPEQSRGAKSSESASETKPESKPAKNESPTSASKGT